jgi:hypothetical protein
MENAIGTDKISPVSALAYLNDAVASIAENIIIGRSHLYFSQAPSWSVPDRTFFSNFCGERLVSMTLPLFIGVTYRPKEDPILAVWA